MDAPQWHVLGDQIREETILAPSGRGLQTVYEVPYQTDTGPAAGSQHVVRVDPRDFSPGTIAERIRADAATVHGVAQLTHDHA